MTETPPSPPPGRSRLLLAALIIGSVVAVLAILPAFVMATMSVMVVAAGTNPVIYTFLVFAFGLPIVVPLGPILAWVAYALRRPRLSWALLVAPAVWALCAFALLAIAPGGSN